MNLPQPVYRAIQRSELRDKVLATEDEHQQVQALVDDLSRNCDVIVIDTAGQRQSTVPAGHSFAEFSSRR